MPHRLQVGLAAAAFLAVACLLALVRALRRAGRGVWRTRLVRATAVALAPLAALLGCRSRSENSPSSTPGTKSRLDARLSPRSQGRVRGQRGWQTIVAAYRRAQEVAEGKKGPYPFDRKGKGQLLGELDAAMAEAKRLAGQGRITQAEADLVVTELRLLKKRVSDFRPTEMRNATCYMARRLPPYQTKRGRLAERLSVLERLARQGRVDQRVLDLVRRRIEADLDGLENKGGLRDEASLRLANRFRQLWEEVARRQRARAR